MYYREKWAVITPQSMYNESAKNIAGNLAQHPEQHIAVWRISDESTSSLMDQNIFWQGHMITQVFLGIRYILCWKNCFFRFLQTIFPAVHLGHPLFTSLFPLYIFLFFYSGCREIGFSTVFIDYIHSGMCNPNQYEGKSGITFVPMHPN